MNAHQNLLLGSMFAVTFVVGVVLLVVVIMFLLALQKCLNRVSPANRSMEPGLVWLNLVPLLNIGWIFYTVIKIAESVVKEGQARAIDVADGGKTIGLVYCVLVICGIIPVVNMLAGPAALICWIVYWVKIAGISAKLAAPAQPAAAPA